MLAADFKRETLSVTPVGWKDLINYRPSRNWAVDGEGVVRVMLKEYVGNPISGDRLRRREYLEKYGMRYFTGLLMYDGVLADGSSAAELGNASVSARFKKTPDDNVSFGTVLRLQDRDNYYAARLIGSQQFEIVKVEGHVEQSLSSGVPLRRYHDAATWTLEFKAQDDLLTARLLDETGQETVRVDARDKTFSKGAVGLTATTFAGAETFNIRSLNPIRKGLTPNSEKSASPSQEYVYPVVKAALAPESLNTSFDRLDDHYDVIVAGAGTGGIGAALQAARLGARVLLLEETDLIGGQMANAGVTSMDDGGIWGKNPVRERGIYREFHESAVNHYYTRSKDPFTAYHFNLQSEGGYEPQVARAILYGLVEETRRRTLPEGRAAVLDLVVRTKVAEVSRQGNLVKGAVLEHWEEQRPRRKSVSCDILVDATEYGDVIPLTGARYRVGTCTSDQIDPTSPMQEHTWPGVIREYPQGIPKALQIKEPPPGYAQVAKRFKNYQLAGEPFWGGEHRGAKGPRVWWTYVAWRGMPDSSSPATGELTELRHTRCGLNGGNDYAVTAATAEDPRQRRKDELEGINRTLGIIYWFQHELGVAWAPADDMGCDTPYQRAQMQLRGVRADLLAVAARLPQCPYIREARRLIGVQTLRGQDLYTRDRGDESARPWASGVAINDYSFDLHGTEDALEANLDERDYINATGPFAVPFEVFIPERVDGFLAAEKNFSQSRLANGATRLQPSTMLNGQAVGAIAALAVQQKIQPRELNIIAVQAALLASGDTLMSRWYSDIAWGTPPWQATQLLALYGVMDRPGPLPKTGPLGEGAAWGVDGPLSRADLTAALQRLGKIITDKGQLPRLETMESRQLKRGEFALLAADLVRNFGAYHIGDPSLDDLASHAAEVERLKKRKKKADDKKP